MAKPYIIHIYCDCVFSQFLKFYLQPHVRYSRRGGGRRLPATPSQPSTLNIDQLAQETNQNDTTNNTLGADLFNFPRLETSPSHPMKNLLLGSGSQTI